MRILHGLWQPKQHVLAVKCECDLVVLHPCAKPIVTCPWCGEVGNIDKLIDALLNFDHDPERGAGEC